MDRLNREPLPGFWRWLFRWRCRAVLVMGPDDLFPRLCGRLRWHRGECRP